jgi:adenylyl- and sulfurtransferase ThiI
MPAKWADVLAPGSAVREEFEKLLSQRIEQDFEPEDELNSCVLDALLEVEDKESLNAELQEVFEDQAASISEWYVMVQ